MGKDKPKRPEKPEAKSTPLDGLSTEQMIAMLKPIQHERASTLSAKLTEAAGKIGEIADVLQSRSGANLKWSGAGFESFIEWSSATAKATRHLSEYAKVAAECLAISSDAMALARNGVDDIATTSASAKADYETAKKTLNAARHDPGAGKTEVKDATDEMNAAATLRERARVEAMMKLRSLGQTYTFEGARVNSVERPVFPPPAGYLGQDWVDSQAYIQMPGSSPRAVKSSMTGTYQTGDVIGGRTDSTDDTRTVRGSDGRTIGSVDPVGPARPDPTRVVPELPADMGIDSVITRPDAPTVPTTPLPVRPEGPSHPSGNQFVPPTFTNGPVGLPAPLPPTSGTAKGLPPLRPGPLGPGGTLPRLPQEHGIVGGRPVPPTTGGRNATGIPRSTVIGGEQPYGRGGAGGVPGPHTGGGSGAGNGTAAGRRLASEQGGVVGGRPQQRGQAGGRPFTPGGSGLVRGGQGQPGTGTGPVVGRPAAGGTGDDGRDERRARRPDYLVEDEETWQQQNKKRPIVPPVVD
ncbi:hypothetical protein [Streptomyces sp. NPDC101115]|uniref:hypothetical protein n=1 Tax=Streptomyces sp. NPDC101115 TaxID=3366106 RepID=UPI0037F797B3